MRWTTWLDYWDELLYLDYWDELLDSDYWDELIGLLRWSTCSIIIEMNYFLDY